MNNHKTRNNIENKENNSALIIGLSDVRKFSNKWWGKDA